jgi:hypothetical protein
LIDADGYPTVAMKNRVAPIERARLDSFLDALYKNMVFSDFQFDARFERLFVYLAENHPEALSPAMSRLLNASSAHSTIQDRLSSHFSWVIEEKFSHKDAFEYLVNEGIL